jgi:hypothetical protein
MSDITTKQVASLRELAALKGYRVTVIRGGARFRLWSLAGQLVTLTATDEQGNSATTATLERKHVVGFLKSRPDHVPPDQPQQAALL